MIHPLLAERFSPYKFRSGPVPDEELALLLDAARRAPSAGNSQPWGFLPVRPGEAGYEQVVPYLARSSARWALDAGLLVVTLARRWVDDPEITYSEFADYDLGQSVAHLTVQAQALGLQVHQFRAFDLDGLTAELKPLPGWEIVSMLAVGRAADEPSPGARERRGIADLTTAPFRSAEGRACRDRP